MASRAKNRKILSDLHSLNNWWDFNQILQELSVPSLAVHITSTICSLQHKMAAKAKNKKNLVQFS
jgi:hypothetical protein